MTPMTMTGLPRCPEPSCSEAVVLARLRSLLRHGLSASLLGCQMRTFAEASRFTSDWPSEGSQYGEGDRCRPDPDPRRAHSLTRPVRSHVVCDFRPSRCQAD